MALSYGDTYFIDAAVIDSLPESPETLTHLLQVAYESGNLGGTFVVKRIGRVTFLTFGRGVADDEDVLDYKGLALTADTATQQLILELRCAQNDLEVPANLKRGDIVNMLETLAKALENGDGCVSGLPCQVPAATLTVRMAFPTKAERQAALNSGSLDELVELVCSKLGADKLKTFFEES